MKASRGANGAEQKPPRSSGEAPAKRNPEDTRERILKAAIREFAENGYGGARVDAICRAARANPRMIYHYFGDKAGLYVAVLEEVLGELRGAELALEVEHVAPDQGITLLFDFIHDHLGKHPELVDLLSGENILRGRFLRRSDKIPAMSSPIIKLIDRLLDRGREAGVFRTDIDALQLYVMMVALSFFHRSNAYTLSVIFSTDLRTRAWQAEQKKHAHRMIARFVARAE